MNKAQAKKNLEIEVLRAIAILLTCIDHLPHLIPGWPLGIGLFYDCSCGVDLFFVISGFVIAKGLLPEIQNLIGQPQLFWRNVLAFWVRRVWRIWPSSWFWLFVVLLISLFDKGDLWSTPGQNMPQAASIILQIKNLHNITPDNIAGTTALGPYWSLSLEEQFYFLLPIAAFLVQKKTLPKILLCVVVAQFFIPRQPFGPSYWSVFFWNTRSDALCLGVLIAISFETQWIREVFRPAFLARFWLFRLLMVGLLVALMCIAAGPHCVFFGTGIIAGISAILVWAASYNDGYLIREGLISNIASWVGARSYAIYLIHMPALYLTGELCDRYHFSQVKGALTAFLAIGILAELNYRLLENPLHQYGRRVSERIKNTIQS